MDIVVLFLVRNLCPLNCAGNIDRGSHEAPSLGLGPYKLEGGLHLGMGLQPHPFCTGRAAERIRSFSVLVALRRCRVILLPPLNSSFHSIFHYPNITPI